LGSGRRQRWISSGRLKSTLITSRLARRWLFGRGELDDGFEEEPVWHVEGFALLDEGVDYDFFCTESRDFRDAEFKGDSWLVCFRAFDL